MRSAVAYFLGVDGGGSKTAAIVVDESMSVVGEGKAGPSNYLRVGIDDAARELNTAILGACYAAKLQPEEIVWTYCGIAGADHVGHRGVLVDAVKRTFPLANFTIDSDARVALTGAIGFGSGIVVIAGTGSVAFGRNEDRTEARAGGWGPTLGDEGSGYAIARRGLSAVVRAFDGRGESTLMTDLLCNRYAMCEPDELPYFVYAPSTHANDIAVYCRMVFEAANNGDHVAMQICEEEGTELGLTASTVARKLGLVEHPFPVAYVGGAFNAGELLLGPMRRQLAEDAPRAVLRPPNESPVFGAARMAIRAAEAPRIR